MKCNECLLIALETEPINYKSQTEKPYQYIHLTRKRLSQTLGRIWLITESLSTMQKYPASMLLVPLPHTELEIEFLLKAHPYP